MLAGILLPLEHQKPRLNLMKLRKLLCYCVCTCLAIAQPTQEEARRMAYAEAQRQGVDPAELEARLQARGINTATLKMSDIPRVQPIVEEEIAKMKWSKVLPHMQKLAALRKWRACNTVGK